MGIIYKATSPSGKSYIGQSTRSLEIRWREHIYDSANQDSCVCLNRAIRKYGVDSFQLTILSNCNNDQTTLDVLEILFIVIHNTLKPTGYNIKLGGSGGIISDEGRLKIRKTHLGVPKSLKMRLSLSRSSKSCDLPMYIIKHPMGFRVCNHPMQNGQDRRFAQFDDALEYLKELNEMESPLPKFQRQLPKNIQRCKHGFAVKGKGIKTKYFLKRNHDNFKEALDYLSATCLDAGNS